MLINVFPYFNPKRLNLPTVVSVFFEVLYEQIDMNQIVTWVLRGDIIVLLFAWILHEKTNSYHFWVKYDKIIASVILVVVALLGIYVGVNVGMVTYQRLQPQEKNYTLESITPELSDYLKKQYAFKIPSGAQLIAGEYKVDASENPEYVRIAFRVDFTDAVHRIIFELSDSEGRYPGNPVETRREWLYRDEIYSYLFSGRNWNENCKNEDVNSLANIAYTNDQEYTQYFSSVGGQVSYVVVGCNLYCCFTGYNPEEIVR